MNDIIAKLAEIKKDLDAIDLAKVKPEKLGEKVKRVSKAMDKASEMDGFNTERLDEAIEMFKGASTRLEQHDFQPEYEKMYKEDEADKRKEIKANIDARRKAISGVKGKYDELTRKRAVIERYAKEFKTDDLVQRQEQRRSRNERTMADNQKQQDAIINFRDQVVGGELDSIKKNLGLVKALETLKKQRGAIKTAQERYDEAKNDSEPDQGYIDHCKAALDQAKSNFDKTLEAIPDVKIDVNNFESSVQEVENKANEDMSTARTSILEKLTEKEGEQKELKTLITRVDAATTNEEFVQAFDEAVAELGSANLNLSRENDNINQNIDTLEMGKGFVGRGSGNQSNSANKTVPLTRTVDDEIEEVMKNDPECQKMIADLNLPVDPKAIQKAVYRTLTAGKRGPHLISFIKSFSKKTQENWMDSRLADVREKAKEKVENARATAEGKRGKFIDSLVSHVMKADAKELTSMEKDKPGKVLNDIYTEMENGDR